MISRLNRGGRTGARAIVIFGALLLLVSQMIGVAHFHEGAVSRDGIGVAQVGTDSGLCPICQLALHAPGSLARVPTVVRGPAIAVSVFVAAPARAESPVFSIARVRAPPVSS
ncbi:hypothetical protein [Candidatus Binatus sp.]|uniref:hypothetical protein n=1 Tax=Candidatus Binatus sp. TaxID=2811406 RepID=UPI003C520972